MPAEPDPTDEQPYQGGDQERKSDPRNHFLESERVADLAFDVVGLEGGGIDGDGGHGKPGSCVFERIDAAVGAGHQDIERRQDVTAAVEAGEGDMAAQVQRSVFGGKRVENDVSEGFHTGHRFVAGLADAGGFTGRELEIEGPFDLVADQDGVAADAAL